MGTSDERGHHERQLWLVPSEGEAGNHVVADVAVAARAAHLLTYAVPDDLRARLRPGTLVRVPYGRGGRVVDGICVRVTRRAWDHTRKPILEARDGPPRLSEELLALGLWISEYYACWPWKTFTALLPAALREPRTRKVLYLRATGREPPRKPTSKQAALLALLAGGERRRDEALRSADVGPAVLRRLCRAGLVETLERREPVPLPPVVSADVSGSAGECDEDRFDLTTGQEEALASIRAALAEEGRFRVHLLFGVPGSGKTEVYVRAVREALRQQRQAIILIPEIALTTQLVERLSRRFARVAVLHSQLTMRIRAATLVAVSRGEVDVVIGTRTAVFAPCPRLGLIIVDEEQESSFKNLAAPFYHARDVAIKRAQLCRIPVVLGSATPALETWHNAAQRQHFELLRLPERVPGARLPEVRPVHTGELPPDQRDSVLSPELRAELQATLAAGQQAILLHNRRGYAVYLRCESCGLMVGCEHCGAHLVYHRAGQTMKCHRCGRRRAVPARCLDDTCGGRLGRAGAAIQRLEEDLHRDFPQARLLRLDSDRMRRRADYCAALDDFEHGRADILLGTQMVAKGLDFPGVRLVGVIEADAALSLPDFRAGERVFQLIVQVVGRAGRREGRSLAVVQTAGAPAVIRAALDMDYEAFAQEELAVRRRLFYPPWARMVRLVCADARPGRAQTAAELLAEGLTEQAARIDAALRVDPAEPCVITRLRELLRYQVLVRGPSGVGVQRLLEAAGGARLLTPTVQRFTIDVDPLDLF